MKRKAVGSQLHTTYYILAVPLVLQQLLNVRRVVKGCAEFCAQKHVSLLWLEQKYSGEIDAIRQIKFQIFCEYKVKTSEKKIWALSKDLIQIQCYTFSQKWENARLGFGTAYKDGVGMSII